MVTAPFVLMRNVHEIGGIWLPLQLSLYIQKLRLQTIQLFQSCLVAFAEVIGVLFGLHSFVYKLRSVNVTLDASFHVWHNLVDGGLWCMTAIYWLHLLSLVLQIVSLIALGPNFGVLYVPVDRASHLDEVIDLCLVWTILVAYDAVGVTIFMIGAVVEGVDLLPLRPLLNLLDLLDLSTFGAFLRVCAELHLEMRHTALFCLGLAGWILTQFFWLGLDALLRNYVINKVGLSILVNFFLGVHLARNRLMVSVVNRVLFHIHESLHLLIQWVLLIGISFPSVLPW